MSQNNYSNVNISPVNNPITNSPFTHTYAGAGSAPPSGGLLIVTQTGDFLVTHLGQEIITNTGT